MSVSAIDLLTKAIEYDVNGRKMEAMKLYETGIGELMKMCKGKQYFFSLSIQFNPMISN